MCCGRSGNICVKEYLSPDTPEMARAAAYIRVNFRRSDLNVNSISAHFGYTPEHFIRTFASLGFYVRWKDC